MIFIFLPSCAGVEKVILPATPTPITQAQIIELSKAKVPDAEIIKKIDATQAVFQLKAADVLQLNKEGVSNAVIDYMLETYTQNALAEQRRKLQFRYRDTQWEEYIPRSRYYP